MKYWLFAVIIIFSTYFLDAVGHLVLSDYMRDIYPELALWRIYLGEVVLLVFYEGPILAFFILSVIVYKRFYTVNKLSPLIFSVLTFLMSYIFEKKVFIALNENKMIFHSWHAVIALTVSYLIVFIKRG
jgi:hypothetical protein